MTPKSDPVDSSDDEAFDEKTMEELAAMASEDEETEELTDDEIPDVEFRNGSPTGPLTTDVEHIDIGTKPTPIEYNDEEFNVKSIPLESVVICRNTKTNWLFQAVVFLMPSGTLIYALVTDKEQAWKLALRKQGNKKNVFKKKDEDATIKRSVADGKPWSEADFSNTEPLFCTPSAMYKAEARKASAKATKAKSSPLTKPPQTSDASNSVSSPKTKKANKAKKAMKLKKTMIAMKALQAMTAPS